MKISTESMQCYTHYMHDKEIGSEITFDVKHDRLIMNMKGEHINFSVAFVDRDTALFMYDTETYTLVKEASRDATFIGGMVEFATRDAKHFEEVVSTLGATKSLNKLYTVYYKTSSDYDFDEFFYYAVSNIQGCK